MTKIILLILVFLFFTKPAWAAGDLQISFENSPMFNVANVVPGDPPTTKSVVIKNTGPVGKHIVLKATKTSGDGLESGLIFVIDGHPPERLSDIFGRVISLGNLLSGQERNLSLAVFLPTSAGNEFQNSNVVFNIEIGSTTVDHLLITEVYYGQTKKHKNEHNQRYCRFIYFKPLREYLDCDDKKYDGQWLEIYNPTDREINLKNWRLENSKDSFTIKPNQKIKPGAFIIITKDNDTLKPWKPPKNQKIATSRWFDKGLNKDKDQIILGDPNNNEVDKVSWGSGFPPAMNHQSTQRIFPWLDTDTFEDWKNDTPSPGV